MPSQAERACGVDHRGYSGEDHPDRNGELQGFRSHGITSFRWVGTRFHSSLPGARFDVRAKIRRVKPQVVKPAESSEVATPELCRILESWNTPADAAVSIARARVAPGVTTKLHRLSGVVERYVIVEGEGRVAIGEDIHEDLRPGDVAIIPAGVTQSITNTGRGDLVFYCVCTPRFTPECYEALE